MLSCGDCRAPPEHSADLPRDVRGIDLRQYETGTLLPADSPVSGWIGRRRSWFEPGGCDIVPTVTDTVVAVTVSVLAPWREEPSCS
jgi:hypothetical protein